MGIEPPYIGLYGVWSMVGIEVRGMGWFGLRLGWSVGFRVFRIRTATLSCARILRDSTPEEPCPMTVPTPHQGLRGLSFGTISYASLSVITRMTRWRRKQPVNHPKNLSTKTRTFGCIYSGKFGTEVTASVMGSCHPP